MGPSMRLLLVLQLLSAPTDAKSFLETVGIGGSGTDTEKADMLAMLLQEEHEHNTVQLIEAVRNQHAKDEHADNQAALRSMYKSMPKSREGSLELPAARYALHRLFEHRHRWFVKGLHPKSQGGKKTMSQHRQAVHKAFQMMTAVDQKGLTLPALAALAGTLEELITREVASHMKRLYAANKHSAKDVISHEDLGKISNAYLTIYIAGADFKKTSPSDIVNDNAFMEKNSGDWSEVRNWIKSATLEAERTEGCDGEAGDCKFDFNASTRVVKSVVEKYGFFNNFECRKLNEKLLEIGDKRTGRVKLAEFYKAGLSGAWQFNEKIEYLRSLGVLDESSADDPKVIVPNYVGSWVNCLSSSKYYAVCCSTGCDEYMEVFEEQISAPEADPDTIVRIVETQSVFGKSMPVSALCQRLQSIADRHHGKVPIHGRLFAQWMHHAFPTTCPYPHEDGKTSAQTPDEWMAETGHNDIKVSEDEVHSIVNRNYAVNIKGEVTQEEPASEIPWTDVEELLVVRPTLPPRNVHSSWETAAYIFEALMVLLLVCILVYVVSLQRKLHKQHAMKQKAFV